MLNVLLLLLVVVIGNGVASVLIRLAGKDEELPEIPTLYFNFFGALTVLFFIGKYPPLSPIWLLPVGATLIYTLGHFLMFKAFKKGEVSLLSPLGNLNPAIIFLASLIFLQESVTIPKIAGIILIIYGMSFLKKQKSVFSSLKAVFKDRNCQFYFFFMLLFALARVIDKRAMNHFQPTSYSFLEMSMATILVSLLVVAKKEISKAIDYGKRKIAWVAGIGFVVGIKYIAFLKAISLIELSIASPVSSLGTLVSLGLAIIFLKEKVEKRWWAAILMLIGAALLVYKI